jgi:hypothetical protein
MGNFPRVGNTAHQDKEWSIGGARVSDELVEGEKTGDGTYSNKCTGPRKLQSNKRFLNIDARPIASFAFLPGALCFFI